MSSHIEWYPLWRQCQDYPVNISSPLRPGGDETQDIMRDIKAENTVRIIHPRTLPPALRIIKNSRYHWKREENKASRRLIFDNICKTLDKANSSQLQLSRHCLQGRPNKQQQTQPGAQKNVVMKSSWCISELCLALWYKGKWYSWSLLVLSMNNSH